MPVDFSAGSLSQAQGTVAVASFTITGWVYLPATFTNVFTFFSLDDGGTHFIQIAAQNTHANIGLWSDGHAGGGSGVPLVTTPAPGWYFLAWVGAVGTSTGYWGAVGVPLTAVNIETGAAGSATLFIGQDGFATGTWPGLMEHIKVYNRPLSAAEVEAERNQGPPVNTAGLVGYYPCSQPIGVERNLAPAGSSNGSMAVAGSFSTAFVPSVVAGVAHAPEPVAPSSGSNATAAGAVSPSTDIAGASSASKAASSAVAPTIAVAGASMLAGSSATSAPTTDIAGASSINKAAGGTVSPSITVSGGSAVLRAAAGTVSPTISVTGATKRFPLTVHASGRYLVDAMGAPFITIGDSTWYAHYNLSLTDQATYLDDRVAKGFNATFVGCVEHQFTLNKPPLDFDSNLPFTKRLDAATYTGSPNGTTGTNGNQAASGAGQFAADNYSNINNQAPDYTYPTAAYWTSLKAYVQSCADRGLLVFVWPSYVGFGGGDEGWMAEMVANDAITGAGGQAGQTFANGAKSLLWNYGAYVADYFKSFSNIVWLHGGDYGDGSSGGTFTTPQKAAVNNLMAGIKSVAGTGSVLHTAHWSRGSLASDVTLTAGSFDLESYYSDNTPAVTALAAYAHSPAAPAFAIEDRYDENTTGSSPWRKYLWWMAALGTGYFYGNDDPTTPLWSFQTGWQSLLNTQCAQDAARLNAFIQSIHWWLLAPSTTVITANGHTTADQTYISASVDPGGSLMIAYIPPAWASTTFTVDMTVMAGPCRARWFDPTNGTYTGSGGNVGTNLSNAGTRVFTPPGNNSSGTTTDWVLVMDVTSVAGAGTVSPSTDIAGGSSATKAASSAVAPTTAIAGTSSQTKAASTASAPTTDIGGGGAKLDASAGASSPSTDASGSSAASKASTGAAAPATDISGASATTATRGGAGASAPSTDIAGASAKLDAASTAVAPSIDVAGAGGTAAAGSGTGAVAPTITVAAVAAMLGGIAGTVSPSVSISGASSLTKTAVGASAPTMDIGGGGAALVTGAAAAAPTIAVTGGSSVLRAGVVAVAPTVDVAAASGSAAAGSATGSVSPTISVAGAPTANKASAGASAPATDAGGGSATQRSSTATSSPTTSIDGVGAGFRPALAGGAVAPTVNVAGAASTITGVFATGTVSPSIGVTGAAARLCSVLAASIGSADLVGSSAVLRFASAAIAPSFDLAAVTPQRHPPEMRGKLRLTIDDDSAYTLTIEDDE